MSDEKADKITVSYDELNTRKVEQRLKEQDALARNRVYASMDASAVATPDGEATAGKLRTLWRNSIFALALFGLIGGLLAWGCGALLEFQADTEQDSLARLERLERLSKTTGLKDPHAVFAGAVEAGQHNPHFKLAVIRAEADFLRKQLDALAVQQKDARDQVAAVEKKVEALSKVPPGEKPEARRPREDKLTQARNELEGAKARVAQLAQQQKKEIDEGRKANEDFAIMYDPSLDNPDPKAKTAAEQAAQTKLAEALKGREQRMGEILSHEKTRAFIRNMLAYGVRGLIIGCLLAIAVPLTENNIPATIVNGSVGAALGLVGGVAAAFVTARIRDSVAGTAPDSAQQYLATVAIWGALGLFLTLAPGVVMRNTKKLAIGLVGGLIGGLLGGVLFEPIKNATEESRLAELVAMVTIGLLAGLATGLIEDAAKTGWVKVVQGLIAGKQFILYRNPTFIGAGPDCQIYLFKDPKVGKRHAAIHIVPGGFELENLPLGGETMVNGKTVSRTRLKSGDRVQIGATQLVFMEKAQAAV